MRVSQVLITLTEQDDGDVRVAIERVGTEEKGWGVPYLASMIADGSGVDLEEIVVNGLALRSDG